jgi:cytochrome c biogenesis protein CcmG/thiol:disulfide interchange protein DsbE
MLGMSSEPSRAKEAEAGRGRLLRRLAFLLVPALVFVGLFAVYLVGSDKPVPGSRAPEFTAGYLDKPGSLTLSALKGKPVVLNFWASWCVPCEDEAPLLQEASEDYEGRVAFVGIDTRDSRTAALGFVDDYGITYPQVLDEGEQLLTRYGLTGQPESFFIDQNGIVTRHVPGPLTRNALYQYLDELVSRNA